MTMFAFVEGMPEGVSAETIATLLGWPRENAEKALASLRAGVLPGPKKSS